MIAEPWDTAGYQVGGFPADWSEWNGKFRDDVRDFWRGERRRARRRSRSASSAAPTSTRRPRRSPLSSVNFVTAHDGFTLADLTLVRREAQRGQRRGQQRRRERQQVVQRRRRGPDRRRARCNECRDRQRRNFLGTLLLSRRRADDPRRRRDRPHPGRQQQRLLPGQRDLVVRLGARRPRPARLHDRADRAARRATRRCGPTWFRTAPDARTPTTTVEVRPRRRRRVSRTATGHDPRDPRDHVRARAQGADAFALLLNAAENGVEFTVPDAPHGEWELASVERPGPAGDGERRRRCSCATRPSRCCLAAVIQP